MSDQVERVVRVRIAGRVQGVGYRAWTVGEARTRGLRGWVRNRRSGDVEAVFAGAAEAVEAIIDACRCGPRGAHVEAVEVRLADAADLAPHHGLRGFVQRATM